MSRAGKLTLLGVVVLAAAAGGGVVLARRSADTTASATTTKRKTATATITQKDVVTYDDTTATLKFKAAAVVASPVSGTVTSIVKSGDTIAAGSVLATVDGTPVVALIGDLPGYRDLSTASTAGPDVRELEMNLVALGFDPNGKIKIDETYDSATAAAVKAWQASLGLAQDGKVPMTLVAYVPGTLLADTVNATIGAAAQAGSPLLTGREVQRSYLIAATVDHGGVIDHLAPAGTPVTTGTVLFWENGHPVVAIEGDASAAPALARDLKAGVSNGADVKLLEQTLATGGFDPGHAMVIDDHFDAATATAITAWLQKLGAPDTAPLVPAGSFVVVPSGLRVGDFTVPSGTALVGDRVVLSLTAPSRVVSTNAPINDTTFALGASILVEYPDGTTGNGVVTNVGNVASTTSNAPGASPTVVIEIEVDDIPKSVASFVEVPVTLRAVSQSVKGAFLVPVSALVALAEGGYAVQVVTGTAPDGAPATKLIGVTPGLFTDGFVAITGADVRAGLTVVVPS